jgi:hypothetical protein
MSSMGGGVYFIYYFFLMLKRCMHVPEFAQGSYAVWNVDYKDISKEDKKG